jgi:hypothetical protein
MLARLVRLTLAALIIASAIVFLSANEVRFTLPVITLAIAAIAADSATRHIAP